MIDYGEEISSTCLANETTNKLRKSLPYLNFFWHFVMDHVIMVDKNYFVISGEKNVEMCYPIEIEFNYIGLKDESTALQHVNETVWRRYPVTYYLKDYDKVDYNSYKLLIVENNGKLRSKLEYGGGVFYGIMNQLIQIINGLRFSEWCKCTEGVGWEIWFGRDEQSKLLDYRMMKDENRKLQKKILTLQKELMNQKNDNDTQTV